MIHFNINQNKSTSNENGEEKRAKKTKQTQNTDLISGAKGPWPPSKCGPRQTKATVPPWQFFLAPSSAKEGTLDYFSTGPLPSLANLQAPLTD